MTRPLALVMIVSAATAVSAQQVFRATVDIVVVNVSVRQGGLPVTGLGTDDFQLTDNGVRQKIELLTLEPLPIDVSLLLDVSTSVQGSMLTQLKNAVSDVAATLHPGDRYRLLTMATQVRETLAFRPAGVAPRLDTLEAHGATPLYDGLVLALAHARPVDRRHLIVAFTDGQDTLSVLDRDAAQRASLGADAVVTFVTPPLPKPAPSSRLWQASVARLSVLQNMAATSGGHVVALSSSTAVALAFRQILEDFRNSYVLRYSPAGVARDGWHEIVVRVGTAGTYEVRARRGYFGR